MTTRSRPPYADRAEAGGVLAGSLAEYADRLDVVVVALPRGGVPVGARLAALLRADLDIVTVRKLGVPGQPELAMGAIAEAGDGYVVVRNDSVLAQLGARGDQFDAVRDREAALLGRRRSALRGGRPALDLTGRVAIVVDDGLATGSTMRAALQAVRRQHPERVVVAVPIGAAATCLQLRGQADEVVCPWQPELFVAVGQGYRDFGQTPDEQVRGLLAAARAGRATPPS